jgi:hypothetical protein
VLAVGRHPHEPDVHVTAGLSDAIRPAAE